MVVSFSVDQLITAAPHWNCPNEKSESLWLLPCMWPYKVAVVVACCDFPPIFPSLWCHCEKIPCGVNMGQRHWSQHRRDGLNMILACFFEPICLLLGVCASRLRLIPAGVTLTHRRMGSCKLGCLFFNAFIYELVEQSLVCSQLGSRTLPWINNTHFWISHLELR